MVLFRPGGVNLRICLCDVLMYASAQPLDFLDRTKIPSFSNWKPILSHPDFPDGHYLIFTRDFPLRQGMAANEGRALLLIWENSSFIYKYEAYFKVIALRLS